MPTISGYANGEPIEAVDINQYFLRGNRNALINGDFGVSQRFGTTQTNVADGAYGLDRWVVLGSGTNGVGGSGQNVLVSQLAVSEFGTSRAMQLKGTTANLKFGCVQIIESNNLSGIRSGTVTVSFKAFATTGVTDVRCAVLAWTGAADVVTRDVVSTSGTPWLSSPPTLAAGWSYLNTPVDLNMTSSVDTYSVNANVTGSPNNLAVFIWVNGTTHDSFGTLQLRDVQLESGAVATPFQLKTFQEQLANCQRYYWRITGSTKFLLGAGSASSTTVCSVIVENPVAMRSVASSVEFSGVQPTDIVNYYGGAGTFTLVAGSSSDRATFVTNNTSSGLVANRPHSIAITAPNGFFGVNAEL
jgi:hypothetical protein